MTALFDDNIYPPVEDAIDPGVVASLQFAGVIRQLACADGDDRVALQALIDAAREAVPAADHVSVSTVLHGRRRRIDLVPIIGSDEAADDVAVIESQTHGPAHDAARTRRPVLISDLTSDVRWPLPVSQLTMTGIRSALIVPLGEPHRGEAMATLHFSADTPSALDASMPAASVVGAFAAIGLGAARQHAQYQDAIASRDLIGQAKGMIMERFGICSDQAFALLTQLSQDSNKALTRVAQDLIDAEGLATEK
ncbi:GAF and ANTAR domain-containing protein [Williamsia deligens]|uniref:GAF and ANTAR domain-containing protein n=1 Tax=Williamsia deligens TaxID=321325 RepID=A0ABW3GBS2_9NOCA|nr:GAF and ANTAR domain-containing protein [Williamsia deligens]MCP2192780.1 GAF domain-containing protein [Williamsia deligens]